MVTTRKPRGPSTAERPNAPGRPGIKCGWCGEAITPKTRGRRPKWCGDTCRHGAWEQTRAAASGRSAIQIVDREVVIEKAVKIADPGLSRGPQRAEHLRSLTRQVDDGRLRDRDLREAAQAAVELNNALGRRMTRQNCARRYN